MDGTESDEVIQSLQKLDPIVTLLNTAPSVSRLHSSRRLFDILKNCSIETPVIHHREFWADSTRDEIVITTGSEIGGLLCDGLGDGILLDVPSEDVEYLRTTSFGLLQVCSVLAGSYMYCLYVTRFVLISQMHTFADCCGHYSCEEGAIQLEVSPIPFLGLICSSRVQSVNLSFSQGSRMRNVKTEYVSCPSCGRTLFDLQEVTAQISEQTGHLPGVTIAVMGCIVNGPGEMADADFGYVGGAPGKIDLYVGKEVVRRAIPMESACDQLIELIKEHGRWMDKDDEEQDHLVPAEAPSGK